MSEKPPENGVEGEDQVADGVGDVEIFRDPVGGESAEGVANASASTSGGDSKAPPRKRRIIAVSGAKGGVGKTVLTTNLAIYFATIGRRVVVVDADGEGANVHTYLGVERPGALATYVPPIPSFRPAVNQMNEPFAEHAAELASSTGDILAPSTLVTKKTAAKKESDESDDETGMPGGLPVDVPIPGLQLMHAGVDEPRPGAIRRTRRSRLMALLEDLDVDYVVVDLGSGTDRSLIDIWLSADLSLFVTLPEPTAIEHTYRFMRAAFARFLLGGVENGDERRRLVRRLRAMGNTPAALDVARALEADGDPLAALVRRSMKDFRFPVVLNQTRVRSDLDLGPRMRSAAHRRLGMHVDYLGYIDYDDTAWNCARMRRPLMVESPGCKASKSIEKVARRLMAIETGKRRSSPMRTVPPDTHHDLLEVDRGATDEEIRRAYKRAREVYAPESLCAYGLFDEAGLDALRARLDEAYDVLLDPVRRRPYELSVFPPEVLPTPARDASAVVQPRPPAPLITPDTEFSGALIRAVRESQGVELDAVASRTKIGLGYLQAIEADAFSELPALVYVRGFVAEMAKALKLDSEQVSRSYIRRYRRHVEAEEG